MKILKKGEDFIKMPDSNMVDIKKINSMIERGWKFASKKEYKGTTEIVDEVKSQEKSEKKSKSKKETKKENKKEKKSKR